MIIREDGDIRKVGYNRRKQIKRWGNTTKQVVKMEVKLR